jgi:hypothetical protein
MIGIPKELTCYLRIVFILLGFDLFYLPFLVKAFRLYILFFARDKKYVIRDVMLYLIILAFILVDCFFLIAWFIGAPVKIDRVLDNSNDRYNFYSVYCKDNHGFLIGIIIYKTVLSAIVWIVSDMSEQIILQVDFGATKKHKLKKIHEASDIKFGITFTFLMLITVLIVFLVLKTAPINTFIGINLTIYIAILIPILRIMNSIFQDLSKPSINTSTPSTTSTTSSVHTNTSEM